MANVYTGVMNGAVQNGYFAGPPSGVPGAVAFPAAHNDIFSFPVESDFIKAGTGVQKGAAASAGNNAYPFKIKDATGATAIVGVLVRNEASSNDSDGNAGTRAKDMGSVITKGFVWVKATEAVAAGDDVYFFKAATSDAAVGEFGKSTNASAVKVDNAKWHIGAAKGDMAIIELK